MSKSLIRSIKLALNTSAIDADSRAVVPRYKVLVVKNSIGFSPGTWLTEREVDELCRNNRWDVTIVSYHEKEGV